MAKYTYPPEFYETGTLPTWEQVKTSHSDVYWRDANRRLARAKKIIAAARKGQAEPRT